MRQIAALWTRHPAPVEFVSLLAPAAIGLVMLIVLEARKRFVARHDPVAIPGVQQ